MPNIFRTAPAIAILIFRPSFSNFSAVIIIPSFFRDCLWFFTDLSSSAARMSIVVSLLSVGESEIDRALKLCPPRTKDW